MWYGHGMEKRRTHAHARTHTHLNVYSQHNDLCHHDKYRTTPIRASKLRHYVSELASPPIRGVQSSPNPAMEGGGGGARSKEHPGSSPVISGVREMLWAWGQEVTRALYLEGKIYSPFPDVKKRGREKASRGSMNGRTGQRERGTRRGKEGE